jgi:hypothetical protein
METDDLPESDDLKIDMGAIDLTSLNMAYTIGAQGSPYSTITTTAGSNGTSGSYQYSPNWSNMTISGTTHPTPSLKVTGDAEFEGDFKWKGRSLGKMLESIEDRLAILQPDPAKLEKFAALKKAYDHYKLMEKLIGDDWKDKQDES